MKIYQRKKRVLTVSNSVQGNPFDAMTHEQLATAGRAAGLPPFCGSWPRETLIAKIKEAQANG